MTRRFTVNRKIEFKNVTKKFSNGIVAVDDVSLTAESGKIYAILGENGAGKTTLMKLLAGFYKPTCGSILVDGQEKQYRSPLFARRDGITMVHQQFSLIPSMTVFDNILLSKVGLSFNIDKEKELQEMKEVQSKYSFDVRFDKQVADLSLGEQQRVEIFRLIMDGSSIMILDEPTSILVPSEADRLYKQLKVFADNGHIILLVTHKVSDALKFADHLFILRKGRLIASMDAAKTSEDEVVVFMVGEDCANEINQESSKKEGKISNEFSLKISNLSVKPVTCPRGLASLSISVRRGEVLGVAGISSNGQDELAGAITSMVPFTGKIEVVPAEPKTEVTISYIPSDSIGLGAARGLSAREVMMIRKHNLQEYSNNRIIDSKKWREYSIGRMKALEVFPSDDNILIENFSGGNLQKIILGRELDGAPDLIIAHNPTKGLDVSTVVRIHRVFKDLARKGTAVIYMSEDLEELFEIADRILFLRDGQSRGIFEVGQLSKKDAGDLLLGVE